MSTPWKCDGQRATARLGQWTARVDLSQPSAGIHDLRFGKHAVSARLFQIEPVADSQAVEIVDHYTRGDDLVVTYAETHQRPVRQQFYWRIFAEQSPAGSVVGFDLIISMQTSLLYSDPTLNVVSEFSTGTTVGLREDAALLLHRPNIRDCSIAQCVHPADCESSQLDPTESGGVSASHRLFDPGLEKGVIRRARLRAALLRREEDEQQAFAAFDSLVAAAPPLTT